MQKIDKVNYTNQLKESVGLNKDVKKGNVHYFDDTKIQRWYVIEESAAKDVLAFANSPEEIVAKLACVTISNKKDLDVVLKYREANKVQESSEKDRLFYLDTLYGVKEHTLRKTLKENKQIPFLEKSYTEVIAELDAYPSAPAATPAQSPLPGQQPGTPVNGAMGGNVIGAAGNEMDFILSDLFDDVLSRIKGLRTEVYAEDDQRKLMAHYFYENLYDMREKIITALKDRIAEQMGQAQPAAATQPAAPATATPTPSPTPAPTPQV